MHCFISSKLKPIAVNTLEGLPVTEEQAEPNETAILLLIGFKNSCIFIPTQTLTTFPTLSSKCPIILYPNAINACSNLEDKGW